ncbi:LacI family DNA-binding transcriptional regulator [Hoylesella loescheii]|uniref:LacI family DNA-binding transcriptional regulator n=1 Tax=Hoylesella loescheii TaxID=840 RepID=UPI0026EE1914|nr:substrate-binding domain-containing protein [Hoylesella loescheii]
MALFKRTSLKDIADALGLSKTTVSFVLNGKANEYHIGEATAKRVWEMAERMQYNPNFTAISLRDGCSKILGIVVSDISNPFFASLARLYEDEAAKIGYTVFFGSSDEKADKMQQVISNLIARGVDGLIIVPCEKSEAFIASLAPRGIPLVLLDRYFPNQDINYVALDNFEATRQATTYILNKGSKHPTIVAYDLDLVHMHERIRGFEQGMADKGTNAKGHIIRIAPDISTKDMANLLKDSMEKGTDGFMFSTNLITLLGMYALRELGCPTKDIKLVGFDGTPAFDFFDSPITYIQQPLEQLVDASLTAVKAIIDKKQVSSALIRGKLIEKY